MQKKGSNHIEKNWRIICEKASILKISQNKINNKENNKDQILEIKTKEGWNWEKSQINKLFEIKKMDMIWKINKLKCWFEKGWEKK